MACTNSRRSLDAEKSSISKKLRRSNTEFHRMDFTELLPQPGHVGAAATHTLSASGLARASTVEARAFLPLGEAMAHSTLPLRLEGGNHGSRLRCAVVADTPDLRARLNFLCGIEVSLTVVPNALLEEAILRAYLGSVDQLTAGLAVISGRQSASASKVQQQAIPEAKGDAAKFLSALLEFGVARNASDLHLCPTRDGTIIKIRIDGELMSQESQPYPFPLHEQVVLRLKALAGLNVACRRLPQDGAFSFAVAGKERAARLSILPASHGESAVVRFLHAREVPSVEQLGFAADVERVLRGAIVRTQGVLLVTGPTGSGKSTTLYALARQIKDAGRNVVSVEDPVESHLSGVVQVPVNDEQGLTYPRAIRSVLRHDPDVIMIGEIRDRESACIALESAATGHLTLSSLHVGSVLLALERLGALGVSRESAVPTVSVALSQRLLPALCGACKQRDDISSRSLGADVFAPSGCEACHGAGFSGRVAVAELLDLRCQAAKQAALQARSTEQLRRELPPGAFLPWELSLGALTRSGQISARQASEFLERESC